MPALFDLYILATAVWYTLRAGCRIYDPKMVIGWFRPPSQSILPANDLEIYNVQTDAWGLLALAALLIVVAGWVPLGPLPAAYKRAAVAVDIGHHALTGWGAYGHYVRTTHYNTSMGVGVWGCAGLAALGVLTLIAPAGVSGLREGKKAKAP